MEKATEVTGKAYEDLPIGKSAKTKPLNITSGILIQKSKQQ